MKGLVAVVLLLGACSGDVVKEAYEDPQAVIGRGGNNCPKRTLASASNGSGSISITMDVQCLSTFCSSAHGSTGWPMSGNVTLSCDQSCPAGQTAQCDFGCNSANQPTVSGSCTSGDSGS